MTTNEHSGPGWPTYARELLAARDRLTLADHIGLALRAHRCELALSQRVYAVVRGWSKSLVAKLETHADRVTLGTVVAALEATSYRLVLVHEPDDGGAGPCVLPVSAADWKRTELLARVRGDGRRFPAHGEIRQVCSPPPWWWDRESTFASSQSPQWYGPTRAHGKRCPPFSLGQIGCQEGDDPIQESMSA